MRSLSPDEAALWARVASTIQPLSREKQEPPTAEPPPFEGVKRVAATTPARPAIRRREVKQLGSTLDGSWDKRLSRGSVEPDRVIDLHGMTLDGAWRAIDRGLEQAIMRGDRLLLLITGHERAGQPPVRRGAIRAAVHDWLAASRHAPDIAAVRAAHGRHGGGGSLYLVLRRRDRRR